MRGSHSGARVPLIAVVVVVVALVVGGGTTGRSDAGERLLEAFRDWPKYGRNLHNTFSRLLSPIHARTVAALVPAWQFRTGDAVTASPAVVNGVVYVGAWDGFFYAIDAQSGTPRWQFQVDCQQTVRPLPPHCLAPGDQPPPRFATDGGLITSSAAVQDGRVYFAAGKTVYALRAADGVLLWKTVICGNPLAPACEQDANDPTRIFSSPAVFAGWLFVGHTNEGALGYSGGIEALDVASGRVRWRFHTDPVLDAHGAPVLTAHGLPQASHLRGCGGVWSSAAVDVWHRQVIFGIADCHADATPPYHESVLALDLATGRFRWAFRPRATDRCDFDFGASANILHLGGTRYVGIGGKDGTYYVLRAAPPTTAGELRWSTRVVFGGLAGGFIGSTAYDGRRIYGGTGYGDGFTSPPCEPTDPRDQPLQDPSFHAFDVQTGTVVWQQRRNYTLGAAAVSADVVFSGFAGLPPALPALRAYHTDSGRLLAEWPMPGAVHSSAAIVGRTLYVGTGNSFDGAGGAVHAFRLPRR